MKNDKYIDIIINIPVHNLGGGGGGYISQTSESVNFTIQITKQAALYIVCNLENEDKSLMNALHCTQTTCIS